MVPSASRPTQSIMYVPLQVNRSQKSILLIVQYKYLKSCSRDFILKNLILRTRSCGIGFITQSSWGFHFHQTTVVSWKCFVPQLYQFRRGISKGPALKYFYMIHRGGQIRASLSLSCCVMLCVAVCCCVLHCTAVCCSVLQCAALMQCVAVCCSVVQCIAMRYSVLQCAPVCCSVLWCVTVCCRVLQCVAVCCSVLQYDAV